MRQVDVLSVLVHADRPMTPAEICGELLLEPTANNRSRVSSRLRELKRRGRARRIPVDGRRFAWEASEPETQTPTQTPTESEEVNL